MAPERPIWHSRYRPERRLSKRSGRHTYLAQDLLTSEQVVIKLAALRARFRLGRPETV
jgi:hypothetical protein